ncbi:MAG: hypothetical protein JXB49_17455 [Bacteroidales bacterium]|nr:hypothetical protein [Bacteroidales bacterium]
MRFLILTLLSLVSTTIYSQDLIILRNGEQIDCKITKVDSAIIHYDFFKGERKLSSYVAKNDIRSYKVKSTDTIPENNSDMLQIHDNTVIIDTTKYVKETNKWINLITYSQRYGLHADGWSVQYYGYNLRNTSKWTIPILFAIEGFTIHTDYFSQFDYQSVNMSYFMAGISPFYKLNDNFFLNLGANIIFGEETLTEFNASESSNTFFGFSPSQGLYFIPKSKVGITLGLSVYEKLLSSKVYKNDIGIKLEIGIKF